MLRLCPPLSDRGRIPQHARRLPNRLYRCEADGTPKGGDGDAEVDLLVLVAAKVEHKCTLRPVASLFPGALVKASPSHAFVMCYSAPEREERATWEDHMTDERHGDSTGIIRSVTDLPGFLVLYILVVEAVLAALVVNAIGNDRTMGIAGMFVSLLMVLAIYIRWVNKPRRKTRLVAFGTK